MTVNSFVAGVLCTVFVEIAIVFIAALHIARKK